MCRMGDIRVPPDVGGNERTAPYSRSLPARLAYSIVYTSALQALLTWCHCPKCGSLGIDRESTWRVNGSEVVISLACKSCQSASVWHSQPLLTARLPAGNLTMAASILFSGATPSKVLRMFQHMKVASISLKKLS